VLDQPALPKTPAAMPGIAKRQRRLTSTETWRKRWNSKDNKDHILAVYFSNKIGPPEAYLTLNTQNT
jgi:hypothetical protein